MRSLVLPPLLFLALSTPVVDSQLERDSESHPDHLGSAFHLQSSSIAYNPFDQVQSLSDLEWTRSTKFNSESESLAQEPASVSDSEELELDPGFDGIDREPGDKTIYEILSAYPGFSRILKAVDLDGETAELFKDKSASITFLAPDDAAFPKKHGTKRSSLDHPLSLLSNSNQSIIHSLLSYHILPGSLPAKALAQNTTYPTTLSSHLHEPRRVKVIAPLSLFPGRKKFGGSVNLYAKFKRSDIKAKNGVMHIISKVLIPPPSTLESTFLVPQAFSTWTSLLQKVNLTSFTEYRVLPDLNISFPLPPNDTTAPAVTVFLPLNSAFQQLPRSLQFFLFSPFGERALKKLLQFHIVPDLVFHADYAFNNSDKLTISRKCEDSASLLSYQHNWAPAAHMSGDDVELAMDGISIGDEAFFVAKYCDLPWIRTSLPNEKEKSRCLSHGSDSDRPPLPRDHANGKVHHDKHLHTSPKLRLNVTTILPTLLKNHDIPVTVTRLEKPVGPIPPSYSTKMVVNGVPVSLSDLVSRNGAIHLIPRLLNPRRKSKTTQQSLFVCVKANDNECLERVKSNDLANLNNDELFAMVQDMSDWIEWKDWLPAWAAVSQ